MTTTPYQPPISDNVRTIAYIVGLVVATLAIIVPPIVGELAPAAAETANVIVEACVKATAFVTGALGTVFRPTGPNISGAIVVQNDDLGA